MEIRYTEGKDEYGQGKPFEPTDIEKDQLIEDITKIFGDFSKTYGTIGSVSVFVIPFRKAKFAMTKF